MFISYFTGVIIPKNAFKSGGFKKEIKGRGLSIEEGGLKPSGHYAFEVEN